MKKNAGDHKKLVNIGLHGNIDPTIKNSNKLACFSCGLKFDYKTFLQDQNSKNAQNHFNQCIIKPNFIQ